MSLHALEKALLVLAIAITMTGMGATLTKDHIKTTLRKPIGIFTGFFCQFGLLPLFAFLLAKYFDLSNELALGLVLVGCSPGGITSNILTYFARGNLSLSIAMTVASSTMACVMMPLLLWIYASPFTSKQLQIPYFNLFVGLTIMLIPVSIGVWIRSINIQTAKKVEKIGGLAGISVLAYLIIIWLIRHGYILSKSHFVEFASCILLSSMGFLISYFFSAILRLSANDRRTISLETGVQNSAITITIVALAFEEPAQSQIMHMPLIYTIFAVCIAFLITGLFRKFSIAQTFVNVNDASSK